MLSGHGLLRATRLTIGIPVLTSGVGLRRPVLTRPRHAGTADPKMTIEKFEKALGSLDMPALPYGKVEDTGLPSGLEKVDYPKWEHSPGRLDYHDTTYIHTSQPMRFGSEGHVTSPLDPETTECFISGLFKRKIAATPDIGTRMLRPTSITYRISESPGKGLGLFATKNISAGELILVERPLIITPRNLPSKRDHIPKNLTLHEMQQVFLHDAETILQYTVERLKPDRKEAFFKLANSHLHDGSGPIMGRIRTNGFGIGIKRSNEADLEEYCVVCDHSSRLNHSCSPNTFRKWDLRTFSMQFRAIRGIKQDEELTTEYCDLLIPAHDRQLLLDHHQMKCSCAACSNPAASDPRRRQIYEWEQRNRIVARKGFDNDPLSLMRLTELLHLLISEQLEVTEGCGQVLFMLILLLVERGDVLTSEMLAQPYSTYLLATTGVHVEPEALLTLEGLSEVAMRLRL